MGRVGESPQPGYQSPAINRPDNFTVSASVTTDGVALFTIRSGTNATVVPGKFEYTKGVGDNGNLQKYEFPSTNGAPQSGQRILNFGNTNSATGFGRVATQFGGINSGWANVTQSDMSRHDNPVGFKMNEGTTVAAFVREGCITFNNFINIGQAYVTGTGGATTQWQQLTGNIFQIGYGLGNGAGAQGKRFYADVSQETKYPLDFLKHDQRWFAFSTRRLSYEADYCMEVYRNNDPTDTALIGWDSNGYIKVSDLALFSQNAIVRVKTWYNQSGNGYHAEVPDLVANPTRGPEIYSGTALSATFGTNARACLRFRGINFLVANTGGSGDVQQPLWTIASGSFDNAGSTEYLFDGDSANRTFLFQGGTALNWGVSNTASSALGSSSTADRLYQAQYNTTNSDLRIDDTIEASAQNVGTGGNDGMTIGARYNATQLLNGTIAEIVMFKGNSSMGFNDNYVSRYNVSTNNYFGIYT
jgi:hypothetical protein